MILLEDHAVVEPVSLHVSVRLLLEPAPVKVSPHVVTVAAVLGASDVVVAALNVGTVINRATDEASACGRERGKKRISTSALAAVTL